MKTRSTSLFYLLYLPVLFVLLSPVTRNRIKTNMAGVIWSDSEGYYDYLPAVFNLHDVHKVPERSMDARMNEQCEVVIKYTCGVAYFELPFFLVAKAYCDHLGIPETEIINVYYARAMALSGYLAGFFGLFFLQRALRRRGISEFVIFLTILAIFGGTNLFHYVTKEMATSHGYSFLLFAFLAWRLPDILEKPSWKNAAILGINIGWLALIRPTNGLLAMLFVLLCDVYSWKDLRSRLGFIWEHSLKILLAAAAGFCLFLPQFWYWHEMTGHWIHYSYEEEQFIYWNQPKILAVLFDSQNGLFVYSPLVLLSVIGLGLDWRHKRNNGPAIGIIFIVATYLFASWWTWWFGTAFGHRSYIDLYPLLAFPMAGMLEKLRTIQWKTLRYAGFALFYFLIFYSVQMSFLYNHLPGPWDGADWRWNWSKMVWIWKHLFQFKW